MHSSTISSKTHRVYSRVEGDIRSGRLTHRAVAVYCCWLLEKSINELRAVLETSGPDGYVFIQLAIDRLEEVYDDLCQARAGTHSDIVGAVSSCEQYLFKCRSALFYLAQCRDGSLPLEGPAGDDISSFCTASTYAASVISILQTNRNLPDMVSSDTRNRLCMLIDSLSDSVTAMSDRDFMHLAQGSAGFASVSEARCAFQFAIEELRALAYTVHQDADMGARGCLRDSFEALLENIREAIRKVSNAPGVTARASWSCTLANKVFARILAMFENFVNGTHTRDADLSDEMFMSTTIVSAHAAARSLSYSCVSAARELPYVPAILECSSTLHRLNSYLSARAYIDLANPHDVNDILPALNKAREALDEVDPSALPSNRDVEIYNRLRETIMQASQRCIMRQCSEPDLLDSALGAGWDDLSIEGLGSGDASRDLHH
ncbi:hypothetical protein [Anaplasma phagocytophilum]|uniref:hypothetical protein n=1 Tax=Anaplasma phagocytophilum TaxID=948 RepID=UPI0007DE5462|nr:hypothetical protein [Anaplasma phagocytophilum]SBO30553.1 hypothetical protein ANAPC2_00296 [Anaplasma phagocytophilum]SBO33136.1 hypothetical protein ANAPC4_01047 [Anaplasma phagocytophilum]SBO33179.1 hypothetical protein ANAPC3_01131 [Anaplasma phagocytophilum]SCV65185.1 hypothetical protein ANAPC5_01076 [Anaplasma phagocytophilum]